MAVIMTFLALLAIIKSTISPQVSEQDNLEDVVCSEGEFSCGGGQCIQYALSCDGDVDCKNGNDERNCSQRVCKKQHFSCGDGQCVPVGWLCDGQADCRNSVDEHNCGTLSSGLKSNPVLGIITDSAEELCRFPEPLIHGKYHTHRLRCLSEDTSDACRHIPGTILPDRFVIYYECDRGYKLSHQGRASICFKGQWKPAFPVCIAHEANRTFTLSELPKTGLKQEQMESTAKKWVEDFNNQSPNLLQETEEQLGEENMKRISSPLTNSQNSIFISHFRILENIFIAMLFVVR